VTERDTEFDGLCDCPQHTDLRHPEARRSHQASEGSRLDHTTSKRGGEPALSD